MYFGHASLDFSFIVGCQLWHSYSLQLVFLVVLQQFLRQLFKHPWMYHLYKPVILEWTIAT
jgi:hypothetical protein